MVRVLTPGVEGEGIAEAVRVIRSGGVIAYPTETFYGLGADPFNSAAVTRIFAIKGRRLSEPLPLIIEVPPALNALVAEVTPLAQRLIASFWPGPLTIVLDAAEALPRIVTGGTGTIGVRCPGEPIARSLCEKWSGPLTATSANRSGDPPPVGVEGILSTIGDRLDLILDGGPTSGGLPSTVVDARGKQCILIRDGCLPWASIEKTLR